MHCSLDLTFAQMLQSCPMVQLGLALQLELLDARAGARSTAHDTTMQNKDLNVRVVVLVLPDHRTHGTGGRGAMSRVRVQPGQLLQY